MFRYNSKKTLNWWTVELNVRITMHQKSIIFSHCHQRWEAAATSSMLIIIIIINLPEIWGSLIFRGKHTSATLLSRLDCIHAPKVFVCSDFPGSNLKFPRVSCFVSWTCHRGHRGYSWKIKDFRLTKRLWHMVVPGVEVAYQNNYQCPVSYIYTAFPAFLGAFLSRNHASLEQKFCRSLKGGGGGRHVRSHDREQ